MTTVIRVGDYVEILDTEYVGRRGKVIGVNPASPMTTKVVVDIPEFGPKPFHWFSVRVLCVLDLLAEV